MTHLRLISILTIFVSFFSPELIGQSSDNRLDNLMDSIRVVRSYDRSAAIGLCLEAEVIAKKLNNYENLDEIYYTLSSVYTWINQSTSLEYCKKGIQLVHQFRQDSESAKYHMLLGRVAASREKYNEAIQHYLLADSIFVNINSESNIAWVKESLGHAFLEKGNYESAIDMVEQSNQIYLHLNQPELTPMNLILLGKCYYKLGDKEKALNLYKEAEHISHEYNLFYIISSSQICMAEYHHDVGNYQKAIELSEQTVEIAKDKKNFYTLKDCYTQLYKSYASILDYKNSLYYLELHNITSDSLESIQNRQLLADLQNTLILEKKNYESQIEQSRLMQQIKIQHYKNRILLILFISACLILTGSAIFFIYRSRGLKEMQRLSDIALETRNREFTNLAMYIRQRGTFIDLIRDDLKVIRKTQNEKKKNNLISALFVKIGTYTQLDNELVQIKEHIEMSTEAFISELTIRFPKLTRKEKRLAQLLYMNLTSKEIALILNIAPQSVDTARYRLRKKINLSREEDLTSIFKDI